MLRESDVAPFYDHGGIAQLVEHRSPKPRAAGSSPASFAKRGGGLCGAMDTT